MIMKRIIYFLFAAALAAACNNARQATASTDGDAAIPVGPGFNADSAYAFCAEQCAFGPRTMNSDAHEQCLRWIVAKFKQYGLDVSEQRADLRGYDGTLLRATNIIARTRNAGSGPRILICAHWDSRPWADNDPDTANWRRPVLAANDGASGVAVMLEIARLIQSADSLKVGIDFVCFDAEDWGTPQWATASGNDCWALGSEHWAKEYAKMQSVSGVDNVQQIQGAGQQAPGSVQQGIAYGILLDMVGGQGAQFYQEGYSKQYAQSILDKVWRAAQVVGYGSYFPTESGGTITDDHVPVNEIAGIPCIDIIPYYPACRQSSFGPTWHTVSDDMEHIDKNTLLAVGQTIIQVIFSE
jgi:Zn-dependent M28 family amino/carboxypeptidase